MFRATLRYASFGALVLALGACDSITQPQAPDSEPDVIESHSLEGRRPAGSSLVQELPGAALDASITVTGSFRPGEPLKLTARVVPTVPVANVEATLWAPEVEYARATGWGGDYRVPTGIEVPSLATRATGLGALRTPLLVTAPLTIDAPGAYEIIVSASGDPQVTDFFVNGTIQGSVWVYISEQGGSVQDTFDPERLSPGSMPVPGPRRPLPGASEGGASASSAVALSSHPQVNVHLYFNENGSPVPVQGSAVEIHELDGLSGPVVDEQVALTDANGIATFSCTEFFYRHLRTHLGPRVQQPRLVADGRRLHVTGGDFQFQRRRSRSRLPQPRARHHPDGRCRVRRRAVHDQILDGGRKRRVLLPEGFVVPGRADQYHRCVHLG